MRPAELFYFIQLSNVRVNEKVFFLIFYSALLYKTSIVKRDATPLVPA